ncbi:hypothetical protein ONZ45_g9755 [Pleurotus djamor]|nr:hypothetical protein ONZ45_g9755 [Pleurotus djamor]
MSLVVPEQHQQFQHILRLLNTNVDGKRKIMYALTEIKGVGRRYSNLVCKKADVDLNKRAGDLNSDELERIVTIIQNPTQFKIPTWFLNRQKDIVDGKNSQILSNGVDSKLRDDLERLKKIRAHRGLRHFWGLRVRGQHTKTTDPMAASISSYTPILHPWFVKPSMKRKHLHHQSSSESSPTASPPSQSDEESPRNNNNNDDTSNQVNPHRPKRRRFSALEKGFSHLSLEQQHNVGQFPVASPVFLSPNDERNNNVGSSQLPNISEMSPSTYYASTTGNGNGGEQGMDDDGMQYENLDVVRPAQVEEPFEPVDHPPTPPIHEINMKSSTWYEPEPDRIVVTDLDDSEDEADVEDNPISLPASVLKHIAARHMGMGLDRSVLPSENTNRALVLFRPLPIPGKAEDDDENDAVVGEVGRGREEEASRGVVEEDDAMDVDST